MTMAQPDAASPWTARDDGVVLSVRVTPRGGRDVVDGIAALSDGRSVLKVRVRVAAEDGAANRAVEKTVARALNVPVSRVAITGGATSRVKQMRIDGDPAMLIAALRALPQPG